MKVGATLTNKSEDSSEVLRHLLSEMPKIESSPTGAA
jgi:hypothetical protein